MYHPYKIHAKFVYCRFVIAVDDLRGSCSRRQWHAQRQTRDELEVQIGLRGSGEFECNCHSKRAPVLTGEGGEGRGRGGEQP